MSLLALLLCAHAALATPPPPAAIAFTGFVQDPIATMDRLGVRVMIQETVNDQGVAIIAIRVYERSHDVYGDEFFQERMALCPAPTPSYSLQVPAAPESKPESVVFDHFGIFDPPKAGDEEQH